TMLEKPPSFVRLGIIAGQRHVGQLRMFLRHCLHDYIEITRLKALSPGCFKRLPGKTSAGKLSAFRRETNVRGAFVTIDDFDRQTERGLQHSCVVRRSAAGADAPELHRLFCRKPFFHRSDAARFAERANVVIRSGSAEKFEFFAIELNAL